MSTALERTLQSWSEDHAHLKQRAFSYHLVLPVSFSLSLFFPSSKDISATKDDVSDPVLFFFLADIAVCQMHLNFFLQRVAA